MKSSAKTFYFSLAITFASIINHAYLAFHYYDLKLGLSGTPSVCNISPTFNCDVVTASNYSHVFGIPVAQLGLFAHLILLLLILVPQLGLSSQSNILKKSSLVLASMIAATSLIMGSLSSALIGSFCLFCILAYVLSFLNFYFILRWQDEKATLGWKPFAHEVLASQKWVLVFFLAIPALAWVGNKMFLDSYGFREIETMVAESKVRWQSAPLQSFNLEAGLIHTASVPVKMTIVEFADFRCPHCKTAAPVLHSFIQSRKDVTLIFKPFPLDGICNPSMERKGDGASCVLASATMCAEKLAKKGFAAHDWIFEHQDSFYKGVKPDELMQQLSSLIKVEFDSLKVCMESNETFEAVQTTAKEGETAKIQGTPTIFVNGKKLDGGQFMPVLEEIYNSL